MSAPYSVTRAKPKYEVADILHGHWERYQKTHTVPFHTQKLVWDIINCRMPMMGGHIRKCSACVFEQNEYNSCRNRHCPKCQALKKAKWLEARTAELLPLGYFHNVFTLPHELNPLILINPKTLLNILFRAVKEILVAFGLDPKWHLKGDLGFLALLHTWDQKLNAHYHLHVIIPAGALAPDKSKWIQTKRRKCKKSGILKDFLFHVEALSKTFRGKYLDFLKQAYDNNDLKFSKATQHLAGKENFERFRWSLQKKEWVVYSKAPFKGPEYVFEYLGRYVHRVAISNDRIKAIENGKVTFTFKNRDKGYKTEDVMLSVDLFITRFLLHELPPGFMKIRYFGFLCNRYKKDNLKLIREFLGVDAPDQPAKTSLELMLELTGLDLGRCPKCGEGRMNLFSIINKPKNYKMELNFPEKFSDRFS